MTVENKQQSNGSSGRAARYIMIRCRSRHKVEDRARRYKRWKDKSFVWKKHEREGEKAGLKEAGGPCSRQTKQASLLIGECDELCRRQQQRYVQQPGSSFDRRGPVADVRVRRDRTVHIVLSASGEDRLTCQSAKVSRLATSDHSASVTKESVSASQTNTPCPAVTRGQWLATSLPTGYFFMLPCHGLN